MEDTTFVEAGGFHGMTVDFILEDRPGWNVVILEPTPALFEELLGKYKNESKVIVRHRALWCNDKVRAFYVSGHSGASSLCEKKSNLGECKKVDVKCLRASTFLSSIEGNIFLNLNCEGAELEIMEDLMNSGVYTKVKVFIKNHKDVMPEPERFDTMFEKMDIIGIDYLRGTYGSLHKAAVTKGISIKELLIERKKPDWAELFST